MGAIKIPHIYNNTNGRTFLFLNYAHTTNEGAVNNLSTVPSVDERAGNFCGVSGVQLYNPYSKLAGTPALLGNGCNLQTGPLPFNSAAQGLLAYIPSPNLTGAVQNFLLQARLPTITDVVNVRVTHAINRKLNLLTGYSLSSTRQQTLGNFPGTAGHSSALGQNVNIALGHNWTTKLGPRTPEFSWSRSRSLALSTNSYANNIEGNASVSKAFPPTPDQLRSADVAIHQRRNPERSIPSSHAQSDGDAHRWLDVGAAETHAYLRQQLAPHRRKQ